MTGDERCDLLELKDFLEKAIKQVEDDLIEFPIIGSKDDYRFLITKAVMYRETLKKVNSQLQTDFDL